MRCTSFLVDGEARYGVIIDDKVYAASDALYQRYPDLRSLLAADALAELEGGLCDGPVDAVRYLPVIALPRKIFCVGVNYRPHIEEMGREVPDYPVVFVRTANSLVGHGEAVVRPRVSEQYDFEGELAVVIGRRARYVRREDALGVIAGVSPFLDGSVRDWQRHTMQFTAGKNFPASGAVGPALVTLDELGPLQEIELTTRVSGERMQHGRIADLVFDIPRLIEYCSTFAELEPGDIIATGTPGGVGAARKPPRWLVPGDRIEIDVGIAGSLVNDVVAESA
jgi:2-keto-4-pentenoate hydratase/2-oxohepta-3-ene-1,7-dioic acid hydratase in catechol pathway